MGYDLVTIDAETHFDNEYSLSRMTCESYCRDPRFEVHGWSVKWGPQHEPRWYTAKEFAYVAKETDWSSIATVAHNAAFDLFILSHHYNVRPRYIIDTLSCARLLLGNHLSVGLDSLAKHFGLSAKTVPYNLFKGKHWHELSPDVQEMLADGCNHDVELTWELFKRLAPKMPPEEWDVIDTTIRMFTEPTLKVNTARLAELWQRESTKKQTLFTELGITEADVQSAERFAALLREEGEEPETKDGKNGAIYAFARIDPYMAELLESDNERVQMLAEARLGAKSTLIQTRTEAIGWAASRGPLPVSLKYAGAHTSRFSASDGLQFQNMPYELMQCFEAPDGFLLATPDSSQVECRCLNTVAGQWDKVEEFRLNKDPYTSVASQFYGYPVNKEDHPQQRQVGKVVELQAGYGSGGDKIRATLRNKAKINLSPEEGVKARDAYRDTHPAVVNLWKEGGRMLSALAGSGVDRQWGPCKIADQRLWLPNGIPLNYETLDYYRGDPEFPSGYWRLRTRNGWTKMYGAKLVQNLIQALARVIVTQAMLRIRAHGYRIVNMRHDDLWILIPRDGREDEHMNICLVEMCRSPAWLPELPLGAEATMGPSYGVGKKFVYGA